MLHVTELLVYLQNDALRPKTEDTGKDRFRLADDFIQRAGFYGPSWPMPSFERLDREVFGEETVGPCVGTDPTVVTEEIVELAESTVPEGFGEVSSGV